MHTDRALRPSCSRYIRARGAGPPEAIGEAEGRPRNRPSHPKVYTYAQRHNQRGRLKGFVKVSKREGDKTSRDDKVTENRVMKRFGLTGRFKYYLCVARCLAPRATTDANKCVFSLHASSCGGGCGAGGACACEVCGVAVGVDWRVAD